MAACDRLPVPSRRPRVRRRFCPASSRARSLRPPAPCPWRRPHKPGRRPIAQTGSRCRGCAARGVRLAPVTRSPWQRKWRPPWTLPPRVRRACRPQTPWGRRGAASGSGRLLRRHPAQWPCPGSQRRSQREGQGRRGSGARPSSAPAAWRGPPPLWAVARRKTVDAAQVARDCCRRWRGTQSASAYAAAQGTRGKRRECPPCPPDRPPS